MARTPRTKPHHPSHIAAVAERMEQDLRAIRHALRKPITAEVARSGLTIPQTAVMRILLRKPGSSVKELSKDVSLSHSTVSGIVDRLEKRGLVKRGPDDMDRRIMRVRPTQQVDSWIEEQLPALKIGPLQVALHRADPAECDAIERSVSRLRKLLSRT